MLRSVWDHLGACRGLPDPHKSGGFAPRPSWEPIPLHLQRHFSIFDLKKFDEMSVSGAQFLIPKFLICLLDCTPPRVESLHPLQYPRARRHEVLTKSLRRRGRDSEHFEESLPDAFRRAREPRSTFFLRACRHVVARTLSELRACGHVDIATGARTYPEEV